VVFPASWRKYSSGFWRLRSQSPTGALPLDPAWGLLSPVPLPLSPKPRFWIRPWRRRLYDNVYSRLVRRRCLQVQQSSIDSSESRFMPTPPAFDAPVRGSPVGILTCMTFGMERREWFGLIEITNVIDGQTDTAWRHRTRAKIVFVKLLAEANSCVPNCYSLNGCRNK